MRNCKHFVLSDTDGSLRKLPASELARKVKNLLGESYAATVSESKMFVIDFMACGRKVPIKSLI